jgi:hypothetical protein
MSKPGPAMVPGRRQENLGLVFQAPECLRVNDPITITLESRAQMTLFFLPHSPPALAAQTGIARQGLLFLFFKFLSDVHFGNRFHTISILPISTGSLLLIYFPGLFKKGCQLLNLKIKSILMHSYPDNDIISSF